MQGRPSPLMTALPCLQGALPSRGYEEEALPSASLALDALVTEVLNQVQQGRQEQQEASARQMEQLETIIKRLAMIQPDYPPLSRARGRHFSPSNRSYTRPTSFDDGMPRNNPSTPSSNASFMGPTSFDDDVRYSESTCANGQSALPDTSFDGFGLRPRLGKIPSASIIMEESRSKTTIGDGLVEEASPPKEYGDVPMFDELPDESDTAIIDIEEMKAQQKFKDIMAAVRKKLGLAVSQVSHDTSETAMTIVTTTTNLQDQMLRYERHALAAAQGWWKETEGPAAEVISSKRKAKARSCFSRFVQGETFDHISGLVIVSHALWIGWTANERTVNPWKSDRSHWRQVDFAYNCYFLAELLIRIAAFRLRFIFTSDWRWNLFDVVIVSSAIIEELVLYFQPDDRAEGAFGMTTLRMLRVLRVCRIVRAIRVMRFFRELRLMVTSIVNCLKSLMWAIMLLFIITWIFGVFFLTSVTETIRTTSPTNRTDKGINEAFDDGSSVDEQRIETLKQHFSSLFQAIFTLVQSVTGGMDWGVIAESLKLAGVAYSVIYCLFVALVLFAVLNVVTGIFVENATKLANQDNDDVIQNELMQRNSYINAVRRMFHEADVDGTGDLTWKEFDAHCSDERVKAFFTTLELDVSEAKGLFRLLDVESTGVINAEDFVNGCLKLKGQARALDVATLLYESKKASKKWQHMMRFLEAKLDDLEAKLEAEAGKTASEMSCLREHLTAKPLLEL
mmetsp:Transcript_63704/g.136946  ORF Transcript_63704/g.136946 Transcript_63704/m.136946 type:complete len:735 (-) Transcript_63704:51-2255(-)